MSAYTLKSSKGPPFPLRSILVFFISLFGFYVCYFSISQIAFETEEKLTTEEEKIKIRCRTPAIPHEQLPYVHFPKPMTYDRGECACTPVRFFVIISMQRSGSGWFETLLNSHPNVSSNGEIFSVKDRRENISSILRTLDQFCTMDWLTSAAKNECTAAFGLKWMLNQGLMEYHHDIANYFNKKGAMVIFLFRRNTLRRLISVEANNYDRRTKQLNGIHKSHIHSKDEADILARFKPKMDVSTLIPSIISAEQTMRTCLDRFSNTRHMILYYEDVIRDQNALSRVQEFLGVPLKKLFSKHVKIHTRPLPDLVDNWEDVNEMLNGTEYAPFLDDPDYVK